MEKKYNTKKTVSSSGFTTFSIQDVEVFSANDADGNPVRYKFPSGKEFVADAEFIKKLVEKMNFRQMQGYFPSIHPGHHLEFTENETRCLGFQRNFYSKEMPVYGETMFAEWFGLDECDYEQFVKGKLPYRSSEITVIDGKEELKSTAVYSHITPACQFANLYADYVGEDEEEYIEEKEMPAVLQYAAHLARGEKIVTEETKKVEDAPSFNIEEAFKKMFSLLEKQMTEEGSPKDGEDLLVKAKKEDIAEVAKFIAMGVDEDTAISAGLSGLKAASFSGLVKEVEVQVASTKVDEPDRDASPVLGSEKVEMYKEYCKENGIKPSEETLMELGGAN